MRKEKSNMIKADILFVNRDKFYDQTDSKGNKITGYELFIRVINSFCNKFNFYIHSFEKCSDKSFSFSLNSEYTIYLKEYSNERYIELYSYADNIEDFTEKFNYIKNVIKEMNIV